MPIENENTKKVEKEIDPLKYLDYWHTDEIMCPYCDCIFEDSWEYFRGQYFDGATSIVTCLECEKEFEVMQNISVTYNSNKTEE